MLLLVHSCTESKNEKKTMLKISHRRRNRKEVPYLFLENDPFFSGKSAPKLNVVPPKYEMLPMSWDFSFTEINSFLGYIFSVMEFLDILAF